MKYKEIRLKTGVSQKQVADFLGISRSYLTLLENEERKLTPEIEEKLISYYDGLDVEYNFSAKFDYVRFRFPNHDVAYIIENVLQMNIEYFQCKSTGLYGYNEMYLLDHIKVLNSESNSDKGILLELSGQGCRNYDAILELLEEDWQHFFQRCIDNKGHATRIDIALDDNLEVISLPYMVEKVKRGEYLSRFRSNRLIDSSDMVKKTSEGVTLYFGSRQSLIHFCFYQKNYEIAKREKVPLESIDVKNRYEIRVINEKAKMLVAHFLQDADISRIIRSIISDYITLVDVDRLTGEFEVNQKWLHFIGYVTNVDLRLEPVKPTYFRKLHWIKNQVASTLKILSEVDRLKGVNVLQTVIDDAELKDNDIAIIETELARTDDFIHRNI